MNRRVSLVGLLLILVTLWASCSADESPAHVVLEVNSDLQVPTEIDRIELTVQGQEASQLATADLRERGFPRTITLVHGGGPLGPLRVQVRGLLGPTLRVEKSLRVWFGAEERVLVELMRSCLAIECPSRQTCDDGVCMDIPEEPLVDAGADAATSPHRDAAVDAATSPHRDAAVDAATSPHRDAAVDAATSPARDAASDAADSATSTPADAAVSPLPDAMAPVDGAIPTEPAGEPPVCSIARPVQNDVVQVLTQVRLRGSCTDMESGPVAMGLSWSSSLDGPLASGADTQAMLRTVGNHRIALCAPDPKQPSRLGCSVVDITASATPQPSAQILSVVQSGSSVPPYVAGPPIMLSGSGTGASVVLSWVDSIQGPLGTGNAVTLSSPAVGVHTVTLTATDRDGNTARATTTFAILERGRPGAAP